MRTVRPDRAVRRQRRSGPAGAAVAPPNIQRPGLLRHGRLAWQSTGSARSAQTIDVTSASARVELPRQPDEILELKGRISRGSQRWTDPARIHPAPGAQSHPA
jgi:hypothetical protein